MRAFDKAGQIGNDERAAEFGAVPAGPTVGIDDTEIWLERGERIVRNFRTCRRDYGNQGRFTRIRETDQADVGEKFKFEAKMALFAGETVFMFARGLMPGLGKILVAAAAASTLRDEDALSGHGQIGDGFAGLFVVGERADGDKQYHVRAGMAGAVRAFAVAAAIGFEFAIVAVAQKRVVIGIRFEINAAAMTAVATRGATARNEFFTAKRDAAVTAAAGLYQ